MSQKTYERLLSLGVMLATRDSQILDAKYDQQRLWQEAIAQAQSHQLLQILHCTAPLEVLRDRLASRTGDIADATPDLLSAQQAAAEPFPEAEQREKYRHNPAPRSTIKRVLSPTLPSSPAPAPAPISLCFYLSKLPLFLYPLACLLMLVALVTLWKRPHGSGDALGLIVLLAEVMPGFRALGAIAGKQNIPPTELSNGSNCDLGRCNKTSFSTAPSVDLSEEGDRILYGAQLYRQKKAPPIIVAGGRIDWRGSGPQNQRIQQFSARWAYRQKQFRRTQLT